MVLMDAILNFTLEKRRSADLIAASISLDHEKISCL
jgi:hypothetical protein